MANSILKYYDKLLRTDCTVVCVNGHTVYPIFKVGSTSLLYAAERTYVNHEITSCGEISVLIRNPAERFVSGLNKYCQSTNLDINRAWHMVNNGELINLHFAPQYVWLMNLYRFYKGEVTLNPFDHIKHITNTHKARGQKKIQVPVVQEYIDVDLLLMERIGQKVMLGSLIESCRHALS